jgi:hypothetical protein
VPVAAVAARETRHVEQHDDLLGAGVRRGRRIAAMKATWRHNGRLRVKHPARRAKRALHGSGLDIWALRALAVLLCVVGATSYAAEPWAPAGAKATLSVDYVYESAGQKRSAGQYDPYEWRVKRSVNVVADLAAQAPTAMPTVQPLDAAQSAQLRASADKSQAVANQLAPMTADIGKIMAKCGEDEACLTREVQKMGAALHGTPQMAAAMAAKKDAQALVPGAPRHQAWRATAQKGSYRIDERAQISVTDPICANRPRHRCTRDEVRVGAGELPLPPGVKQDAGAAGMAAVEVDSGRHTLTLALPVPLFPLPYTETITSDEPAGTHDTPIPKGPQPKLLRFRVDAAGSVTHKQPMTVALKGGWRNQSGEQRVQLKGDFGDAGQLTVRWRFQVQ